MQGHGFMPRSGKIPHAAERLGLWAMAAEPARPEPVLCNRRGHNGERPVYRKKNKNKNKNKNKRFSPGSGGGNRDRARLETSGAQIIPEFSRSY